MKKEDLRFCVFGSDKLEGGLYNVLGSFAVGLREGFEKLGVQVCSFEEMEEKKINPNIALGFNASGYQLWAPTLEMGFPVIMWAVDSVFTTHLVSVQAHQKYPKFALFSVTKCDQPPIQEYFPNLQFAHLQHATSLDLWRKQDVEKDIDVVLFSTIHDNEASLEQLKSEVPDSFSKIIIEIYNIALENPQLPFWDLYQILKSQNILNLDASQYAFMFERICYLVMNVKKVQAVQALSDFHLKIYGSGPWEKYISGNIEYLGPASLKASIDIMNRSKIALHPHAITLHYGLHERILNASAVETFVLSSEAPFIKDSFGDNMAYYNNKTFEDIADKLVYYLKNDDERIQKAKNCRKIVEQNHTWDIRAKQIIEMLCN